MKYTAKFENRITYKGDEKATSADGCRCVSVRVSVHQYSVQYKGYNLIGVTTVDQVVGTTALVYYLINISLYTGTEHRWWSTPKWFDGHQR
jgi:hypothetical protein